MKLYVIIGSVFILLVGSGRSVDVTQELEMDIRGGTSFSLGGVKRDVSGDVLHHRHCLEFRTAGYCKYGLIRKKFCIKTCSCYDVLSNKSCEIVKRKKECGNVWAIRYCHLTCHKCFLCTIEALGMQSKAIPDSRITALSMYNHNYAPSQGRLHYKSPKGQGRSGSWSAKTNQAGQWIQVDLGKVTKVSGIATQGRYDADQWVTSYTLQYSIDGKVFMDYKAGKVLAGNKDRNTVVMHDFHTPIITRYIRVVVKSWTSHISMRMELYGCK